MTFTITLLLLGLGAGAAVALTALGLVLMYRSSGVLNFASGAIGMASAYFYWELTAQRGWPEVAAGLAAVALGALIGLIGYFAIVVAPTRGSNLMRVVGTLGLLVVIQSAVQLRYGATPLVVDDYYPSGLISLGGVEVQTSRIILLIMAVTMTAGLALVYERTTFGLATTAMAESPQKLAAMGWRIGTVGAVNWTVGGALAGFAGVLLAPIQGLSLSIGTALTVTVLAAALIGGLRSFGLTLLGGLVIGMLQSLFVVRDLGVEGLSDAIPFVAIVFIIVVRGKALPLRNFVGERLPRLGTGTISWPVLAAATVIIALLIGPLLDDDGARAITTSLLAAMLLLSFVVLLGFAGQMSLAQVTLAGFGGLVAARLVADFGWPFPVVFVVGTLATVPVGLLVGLPSARTRGVSLAIATLGLAVAIDAMVFNNPDLGGGNRGIQLSLDGSFRIFGIDFGAFSHPDRYAYLVLGFVVVVAVLVANLRRSATGRQMIAVRNNERAAAGLGINVVNMKLWAFGIAAAVAGSSGVLATFRQPTVLFENRSVLANIQTIGFAVIGGVGSVLGAAFGSLLEPAGAGNQLLGGIVGAGPIVMGLIGGLLLIVTIIVSPDGIALQMLDDLSRFRKGVAERRASRWMDRFVDGAESDGRSLTEPTTLVAEGITVTFGSVRAVSEVALTVEPGEIVGVVGANGAGKTTLIDSLTGFVPAEGSIRMGDVDLTGSPPHLRSRHGLCRSWQSLELIEDLTVLENLRVAAETGGRWSPVIHLFAPGVGRPDANLVRLVESLDLRDVLGRLPGELSTGQRKRVALARAIASGPSTLLLDEPCSGLDTDERNEVASLVEMLARDWGIGVLLVEHDVQLVRRLADRVMALDFGSVVAKGDPDSVLTDERVMAAFLGETPDNADVSSESESTTEATVIA